MRYFENFPKGTPCPICGTNENKECFLVPIDGTEKGNIYEAIPVHKSCVFDKMVPELRFNQETGLIYFKRQ